MRLLELLTHASTSIGLSSQNMRLLELLLVEHAQPRLLVPLLNSPELGAKFGGFLHELVLDLCGPHRLNLMVADPSAYAFSPKRMVAQVGSCQYKCSSISTNVQVLVLILKIGGSPKRMVSQVG